MTPKIILRQMSPWEYSVKWLQEQQFFKASNCKSIFRQINSSTYQANGCISIKGKWLQTYFQTYGTSKILNPCTSSSLFSIHVYILKTDWTITGWVKWHTTVRLTWGVDSWLQIQMWGWLWTIGWRERGEVFNPYNFNIHFYDFRLQVKTIQAYPGPPWL